MLQLGPLTTFSALCVLVISVVLLRSARTDFRRLGLAFVVSWLSVRVVTATGAPIILLATYPICAALCFSSRKQLIRIVGLLYGVRALVIVLVIPFDLFIFWEVNRVVFYAQLFLAVGIIIEHGGGRRVAVRSRAIGRGRVFYPVLLARDETKT